MDRRKTAHRFRARMRRLQARVNRGDPDAIWELGAWLEDGYRSKAGQWLVKPDPRKAVRLFRRAVSLGSTDAMVSLANLIGQGRGTRRNAAEALVLERRAARRGNAAGAYNAGISYRDSGRYRMAVRWFSRAAAMGDDSARIELAHARILGWGTRRDLAAAIRDLTAVARSAGVNNEEQEKASVLLAWLYMDGWLILRSPKRALLWLRLVAKLGNSWAKEELRRRRVLHKTNRG